ncbi:hypothetical protein KKH05_02480 [Patescibacteria group bacterium]|nr:hypothetical protein [Patescibacteria group bacterium]
MKSINKYLGFLIALTFIATPLSVSANADFGQLVVSEDISPAERVVKKTELTKNALSKAVEKAQNTKASLEKLSFEEESIEAMLKDKYLTEVDGYISFYKEQGMALEDINTLEEVDALIQGIIEYREQIYSPSAKNVLEFILVFSYGPSVLDTAQERLGNIEKDIERLEGLELIDTGQFIETLDRLKSILGEAIDLQSQARLLVLEPYQEVLIDESALPETAATTTLAITQTPKELVEESLNKIKGLYNIFIETGQKVKETLGI